MRSWWHHEQVSIAAAVAAALHHSAGPTPYYAPRRQKTATAREEVENVTHSGPRALKTPPPGERPGILAEPGPQRSDRTVPHSAGGGLSTLALPYLAGSAAEAVDASTLNFLLGQNLARGGEEGKGGGGEGGGGAGAA